MQLVRTTEQRSCLDVKAPFGFTGKSKGVTRGEEEIMCYDSCEVCMVVDQARMC